MAKNKFVSRLTLSFPELMKERAENQASLVELSQLNKINTLKNNYLNLKAKLDKLTDLGPNTTVDLKVPEINPEKWVEDVQNTKEQLVQIQVQLEIATETYEEWFSPLPELPKKDKPVSRRTPRSTSRKATKK